MSRHGYTDDDHDPQAIALWRGSVGSAIRGKRGQQALRDLLAALDAMPAKRLVRNVFRDADGECCSLGLLAESRGVVGQMPRVWTPDMTAEEAADALDSECDDYEIGCIAADVLDIARCMAAEIMYENDEGPNDETPEQRWARMRRWVERRIRKEEARS